MGPHTIPFMPGYPDIDMNKVRSDAHGLGAAVCATFAWCTGMMQLTVQLTAALHVDRLTDRLERHPHLRKIGKVHPQPPGDLLGTVLLV